MEDALVKLGVDTFKIALMLSLPMLLSGMIVGLAISIFQATTQINEMTLSFVPKILVVIMVTIFVMPWMITSMVDFSTEMINMIPSFVQ